MTSENNLIRAIKLNQSTSTKEAKNSRASLTTDTASQYTIIFL